MSERLYINEDITDWHDETMRDENVITAREDILDLLQRGTNTAKIARAAIVSRAIGKAPTDIVRPNRVLIQAGAMLDISQIAHQEKEEITVESGATYKVPAFIGQVKTEQPKKEEGAEDVDPEPTDGAQHYVHFDDPLALDRAMNYLRRVVGGHIWNRLMVVYANGGNVEEVGLELHGMIDDMVMRLV